MKYHVWQFHFTEEVHFGNGGLNTCDSILHADTIFSALCIEAIRAGKDTFNRLVDAAKGDRIRFSDALPYIGNQYYIPKPIMKLQVEKTANSIEKKALKKLEYLPVDQLTAFLHGALDIRKESEHFAEHFGSFRMIEKASINGMEETRPYGIEGFHYAEGSGLYLCCGYEEEEDLTLIEELLESLEFAGVGGEISSGLGRFELCVAKTANTKPLLERIRDSGYRRYLSLSVSLPKETELEQALSGAEYQLIRRGGFIASETYAATACKKRDLYVFAPGSTFVHLFNGDVYVVSDGGTHPVYRYARPLFIGVE